MVSYKGKLKEQSLKILLICRGFIFYIVRWKGAGYGKGDPAQVSFTDILFYTKINICFLKETSTCD